MDTISAEELKQRLDNNENIKLIDVREEWEFEEYNIGAELIPLSTVPFKLDDLADFKNQEIVVHCRSGKRSATAQAILKGAGFSNVRNLTGGILAWQALS